MIINFLKNSIIGINYMIVETVISDIYLKLYENIQLLSVLWICTVSSIARLDSLCTLILAKHSRTVY